MPYQKAHSDKQKNPFIKESSEIDTLLSQETAAIFLRLNAEGKIHPNFFSACSPIMGKIIQLGKN